MNIHSIKRASRGRWIAAILASCGLMICTATQAQIVATDKGNVYGNVTYTYRSFLGIPYAAPPTGNLRWRAPQPAAAWPGFRYALYAGNVCTQTNTYGYVVGAEDCLVVNVYTPPFANGSSRLPVLVWVHGGALNFGSSTDAQYDPTVLTGKANAIIVSMNYRLGAFGFLGHPALFSESSNDAGNYGLLDIQAALRWVKTNIANFGGDPAKVTLFGGSSGGLLVWDNIASPNAAGLFQRAITQSFAPSNVPSLLGGTFTVSQAQSQALTTASTLGCPGSDSAALTCLRGKTNTDIVNAQGVVTLTAKWGPVYGGGTLLPRSPFQALTTGNYNHVGVINGTNHDEGTFIVNVSYDLAGQPLTAQSYAALLNQNYGSRGPDVLAQYPVSNYSVPGLAYAAVLTDSVFSCPARTTDRTIGGSVSLYAYEFNDPNAYSPLPHYNYPLGSYHSAEIQYIFQSAYAAYTMTAAQIALSNQMIKYWSTFAATGSPNSSGSPNWPSYNSGSDSYLSLEPSPSTIHTINTFAGFHKCAFWATFGI